MEPLSHECGSSKAYTFATHPSAASTHLPLERSDKTQGVSSPVCLKEGLTSSSVLRANLQDTLDGIQEVRWSSLGSLKSGIPLIMGKGEELPPGVSMASPGSWGLLDIQQTPTLPSHLPEWR